MNKRLTPLQLEMLLRAYYSPDPFGLDDSEPHREAVKMFIEMGAMKKKPPSVGGAYVTNLGEAWIEMILRTPRPTTRFAYCDEKGNVLGFMDDSPDECASSS